MKVKIDSAQIHHLKEPICNADDVVIGMKDVLQFDVKYVEYPRLPTYSLRIDIPITKAGVVEAIKAKMREILAQREIDSKAIVLIGTEFLDREIEV